MSQYSLVKQEEDYGCGAACVASLLGISYGEAKALVEKQKGIEVDAQDRKKRIYYGLELHHIALALQEKGIAVVADWREPENFPDGTIVCISGEKYEEEHYMLKTPHGWMDPWHNMGEKPRNAGYRKSYPRETQFVVALVPATDES